MGPAVKFSDSENQPKSAPPALGQHTKEVLKDILGYSDQDINDFANEKVIQIFWTISIYDMNCFLEYVYLFNKW